MLKSILFTLYVLPLRNIHCYSNDTQLYLFMTIGMCRAWMSKNLPLLNSDKTEVVVFGPKHLKNGLNDFMLSSSATVRNCKVIFDQTM